MLDSERLPVTQMFSAMAINKISKGWKRFLINTLEFIYPQKENNMTDVKCLTPEQVVQLLQVQQPHRVLIEGWLIGTNELFIVDEPENPSIKLLLPEEVHPVLIEKIPERLRVGGKHYWQEKVVVSGTISQDGGVPFFIAMQSIKISKINLTIDFALKE